MGVVGHHMITFSREAIRGQQNASFYSAQQRHSMSMPMPPEAAFEKLRRLG